MLPADRALEFFLGSVLDSHSVLALTLASVNQLRTTCSLRFPGAQASEDCVSSAVPTSPSKENPVSAQLSQKSPTSSTLVTTWKAALAKHVGRPPSLPRVMEESCPECTQASLTHRPPGWPEFHFISLEQALSCKPLI